MDGGRGSLLTCGDVETNPGPEGDEQVLPMDLVASFNEAARQAGVPGIPVPIQAPTVPVLPPDQAEQGPAGAQARKRRREPRDFPCLLGCSIPLLTLEGVIKHVESIHTTRAGVLPDDTWLDSVFRWC